MRVQGLLESLSLAGWRPPARRQLASRLEHAVDAGGADVGWCPGAPEA
jgi:hypothetical protein